MKLKYYLRGLGTGILFASIVLTIAYSYRTTDSKIKEQAKDLGMVYPNEIESGDETDESDGMETLESNTQEKQTSEEQTSEKQTSETQSSSEENTDDRTETTTTEPQTDETETTTSSDDNVSCTVTVTSRTTSYDVARQLESGGIIEDADDFDDYLCDNGYAYRIQNGKYTITKGMNYKEMAEIITTGSY